jgi:sugar/nucleoside kinase (ribokinase family)
MIISNGPLDPPQAPVTRPAGRPGRLVFAGEAIVDVVMRVPGLPPRGGDLLATSAEVAVGGGFNVMAAAARQGLPVLYAGGHGAGHWGDLVRAALAAEGIGLLRPPDPSRDTGFDVALVEPDAERTFVTALGAESVGEPGGWDAVPAGLGDVVYVSGYGLVAPGSGANLGRWAAALAPTVLLFVDPGPLVAQIPPEVLDPVLARCDWLSCNAREAALLTGVTAHEAAPRLLARTARANVIVRLGPDGCLLATRPPGGEPPRAEEASEHIPAPAVDAVDTTGAGDAHAGVFLAALADGLAPADAARRANTAAALAVTRPGPATSPTRAELDAWN